MSGTRGGVGRIVAMGIGLAVALLLLVAREARAGKYAVAQCGWYVGADADWADTTGGAKFRPDAYCVPPPGADPFDGVHLKSFTRDGQPTVSGTRFARWRWAAPAGTGITQVRGTWWHALHDGMEQRIGVGNWGGGFDVFADAAGTDATPREFVAGFSPAAAGVRGPAALRQGRKQVVQPRPGLLVGDPRADDHHRGRLGPGAGDRRRNHRGRLAARRPGRQLLGRRHRRRHPLRRDDARRRPRRPHRVPLREGADRRRVAGDPDAALPASASPAARRSRPPRFSDGPHSLGHCVTDFAGNVGCTPAADGADRQQPARPPAQPRARRGRGLAPRRRLRLLLGQPRPGPGEPDRRRLLADHRAGRLRHRRPVRGRARPRRAQRLAVPGPGRSTRCSSGCATRPATTRRLGASRCRCASTTSPPGSPSTAATARACRTQVRADVTDAHSGPAGGTIFYRRLDSSAVDRAADQTPAGRQPRTRPTLVAQPARRPRPRHLSLPRRRRRRGRQHRLDHPPRRRHRDGAAQDGADAVAARRGCRRRGRRGSSPGCAGATASAPTLTVPFGAGAVLSGRLVRADGAGLAGPRAAGRLAALARRPRAEPASTTVRTGPHGGFQPRPRRRPLAPDHGQLPAATTALEQASRPLAAAAGARRRQPSRGAAARCAPARRCISSGRVRTRGAPVPRRGKLVAIQYFESATQPLAPGAGHPHRPQRPLPRPLPLPLRDRRGLDPPAGDRPRRGALALRPRRLPPANRSRVTG